MDVTMRNLADSRQARSRRPWACRERPCAKLRGAARKQGRSGRPPRAARRERRSSERRLGRAHPRGLCLPQRDRRGGRQRGPDRNDPAAHQLLYRPRDRHPWNHRQRHHRAPGCRRCDRCIGPLLHEPEHW